MGAEKMKEDIDQQHQEAGRLLKNEKYKDVLIPFTHIDPIRPEALASLKSLVEPHNFREVKIYPTLGYG
ncbi:hypothetical protein [Teredinibacter haidensis]|uniref:hypothetical protein n=1 Tax=Teredinibacter haidensis TaxID=2731755 RepID=UPI000A984952|nr:hypothetical protein [Teredinibacter haidensis]